MPSFVNFTSTIYSFPKYSIQELWRVISLGRSIIMSLIQVDLDEFLPWFESRLDEKHSTTMRPLKTLFLSFICLVNQLIHIFIQIRIKIMRQAANDKERQDGRIICDNSIYTLKLMQANFPTCLDLSYCECFAKDFEEKLNLLFWYYHSLSHLQQQGASKFKQHNDKIVEGIKKLVSLVSSIIEHVKESIVLLKNMNDYKKLFSSKISSIKAKIEDYGQSAAFFREFEKSSVEYCRSMERNLVKQEEDLVRQEFMTTYFQLVNHSLSIQVQLESLLQLPIRVCQELKSKKRLMNVLAGEPKWATLSKYTNIIVKPNFVVKHIKKVKLDELIAFVRILYTHHKDILIASQISAITVGIGESEKIVHEIRELAEALFEDMRQLQKVEKTSVGLNVNNYRNSIIPSESRKFYQQLSEYQNWMHKYYRLNEQIKSLQKIVQTIVAKQTNQKVQLIIVTTGETGRHTD